MSERLDAQMERINRYEDLIARAANRAVRPYRADGYVNMVTKYGTQKDASEQYRFVREPVVPDELLVSMYEGNGLFAKIINAPAEEALKNGFELDGIEDEKINKFYAQALDELDWTETAITAIEWARLFGGAIAVLLVNDGGGLDEPLNWRKIKSIDDIRIYDRSIVTPDYASMYFYSPSNPFDTRGSRLGEPEYYNVYSKYGDFRVHESRCLVFRNGRLPENTTNSEYELWGIPEYVRIHRQLRDVEVAYGSGPKMLDRSVQPVYQMSNLSNELSAEGGEDKVLRRIQAVDMARGMMNTIVIDKDGEDYGFRTFSFAGTSDLINTSCNVLSAVTNIPQTVLFGRSPAGENATGHGDMENYYNYVGRIQQRMLRTNLRYLLSIIFQAGLATGEVDEIPEIDIKFKPLWSLSDAEQADLDLKHAQLDASKASTIRQYVDMQVLDPSEVRKKLAEDGDYDICTMLDDIDEETLNVTYEKMQEQQQAAENEEAPAAAPDATKLPQDIDKEAQAEASVNTDGGPGSGDWEHNGRPGKVGGSSAGNGTNEKLNSLLSERERVQAELNECFQKMCSADATVRPELIEEAKRKSARFAELNKEIEENAQKPEDTQTKMLERNGHPDEKTIINSLPEEWKSKYSAEYEQTYGEAVSANLAAWSGEEYTELKDDYAISKAIELTDAKWDKGELYRGMSLNADDVAKIQEGGTIRMNGLSSWSSDISPAMQFATTEQTPVLLVDKTSGKRNAMSIAAFSKRKWEQEVLYGKDQEFTVKNVSTKEVKHGTSANGSAADFSKSTTRKVTVIEVESK